MHFIYRWLINLFQSCLRYYKCYRVTATIANSVSKSQFEQNRDTNMQKVKAAVDKGESTETAAITYNIPHSAIHDRVMRRQSKNGFKVWAS